MARMVNCIKLKREAEGLDYPPYPGELGKRLYETVSKEAWKGWLEHNNATVMAVVLMLIGVVLFAKGLGPITS